MTQLVEFVNHLVLVTESGGLDWHEQPDGGYGAQLDTVRLEMHSKGTEGHRLDVSELGTSEHEAVQAACASPQGHSTQEGDALALREELRRLYVAIESSQKHSDLITRTYAKLKNLPS